MSFFRYFDTDLVPERNGMSGWPVFHHTATSLHEWLAGMHVCGNREHKRFIEADVLLGAIERVHKERT